MTSPLFVVLEGGALSDQTDAGARRVEVSDAESAVAAVLAALEGVDLVVEARAERAVIDQLCDDLRRLGTVEHRLEPAPATVLLSPDERALLAALLAGDSLGAAATRLHLSRRTADRRLASARRALGASSTAEALVLAARAGIVAG